jgi:3'-phosphoadenosine 5'-phosphosulfate sulfotransferase (PAPS reductase)/FAD synthetase
MSSSSQGCGDTGGCVPVANPQALPSDAGAVSPVDRNPYLIEGPALISFSGGRTSAYMLWHILQAHGGKLPDDVVVAFANTGKEREETLRFVHECGVRWNVPIRWVEYRSRSGPKAGRIEEVGYNSASRHGEPLAALIASKKYTPNSMARFCTEETKLNTIRWLCEEVLGWGEWTNVVGLRFDEMPRLMKVAERNFSGKTPWRTVCPLADAKIARKDVLAFWAAQPFDLGLRGYEGNCDLCFLKGRGTLKAIIRENPGAADWWIEMERVGNGRFVTEYSYADLKREVLEQPSLFDPPADEHDAECGLWCAPDEQDEAA